MKVVIVNCFDTIENRVDLIYDFFKAKGYEVTVIQSDFKHIEKVRRVDTKDDYVFVKTRPYYRNLSVTRLYSHHKYAREAFKIVEEIKPELLYTFVPPNSLTWFANNYKKRNDEIKLIIDLIDLWPESMPIGNVKKYPPFTFWRDLRDKNLEYADLVITECNLYQSALKNVLIGKRTKTIYLARRDINVISNPELNTDEIHLAYLGSINNIIDIPKINQIIKVIMKYKLVTLHIVGEGENKLRLIESAQRVGAKVQYHGRVFDPQAKQDIFDSCHFGLNIMKPNVCVGLTMKSIDYFQHGLPIINNIPADTAEMIEKHEVGINVLNDMSILENTIKFKFNEDLLLRMRRNSLDLFQDQFSVNAFNDAFKSLFKE